MKILNLLFAVVFALAVSNAATAQEDDDDYETWNHILKIYIWGASIEGRTAGGQDISVGFDDLLDSLNFGLFAGYEARKGDWLMMADLLYLDVGHKESFELGLPGGEGGPTVDGSFDFNLQGTVLQAAGGFNFYDNGETSTDFLFGVRYLDLDARLDLTFDLGLPDREQMFRIPITDSVIDGYVGIKSLHQASDKWNIIFYGDIGAGESDMTWQAMLGATYQVSARTELALTYRYLGWKIRDDVIDNIDFSGPLFGAIIRF